jgi:ceramide glucosyltransferase
VLVWFQNGPVPFSKFEYCVGWLFRECTTTYLLLKATASPYLVWRSKTYKLFWGGSGEEVRSSKQLPFV